MSRASTVNKTRMRRHWQVLCEQIGNRLRGTANERRAAKYIEQQFQLCGLDDVHQHQFDFPDWRSTKCTVRAGRRGKLKTIKTAVAMAYSPATTPRSAGGRLVYLQEGHRFDFDQPTRGRVGLLIGSLNLGDPQMMARLERSGLAALLVVDARNPWEWRIPAGGGPQWFDRYSIPTVSISYYDAIELAKAADAAAVDVQVTVKARTFAGRSQNVIGEATGTRRPDQVIIVSAHYDCVSGNVGANDDASGTVLVLEMARLFGARPAGRTVRFIAYGSEENLSVGAYLYMRSLNNRQCRSIVLAMMAGSIAGYIGHDRMSVTGPKGLEESARRCWRQRNHPINVHAEIQPYGDQFSMSLRGVPVIWLSRPSVTGRGFWQHHGPHDHLGNVNVDVAARTTGSAVAFVRKIADAPRLPFTARIDAAMMKQVREFGRRMYRHPWSPDQFRYPTS